MQRGPHIFREPSLGEEVVGRERTNLPTRARFDGAGNVPAIAAGTVEALDGADRAVDEGVVVGSMSGVLVVPAMQVTDRPTRRPSADSRSRLTGPRVVAMSTRTFSTRQAG